jgi:hypothetical protein
MILSLWRRPRNRNSVSLSGKCRRPLSSRPRLEPLEDRLPPALCAGASALPERPAAVACLVEPAVSPAPAAPKPITVTVPVSSPPTVVDLGRVFAGVGGLQHKDGLKLSVLRNTNSGLVTTDLSEAALTLSYTPKMWGTATITVGATDADGVSVQTALLVRVQQPVSPPVTVVVSPVQAAPLLMPVGTFR